MYKQLVPVENMDSYFIGIFLDQIDEDGMPTLQILGRPRRRFRGDPVKVKIAFVKTKGFTKPLVSKKVFEMKVPTR